MEKIEVFELDDDFDPLEDADLELETDAEYAGGIEYQVPIPDADKSVVPEAVELPAPERIEKLIAGIPGQKFRILSAIRVCDGPKTLEEAAEQLESEYPQGTSVYDAVRIIELLQEAGALMCVDADGNEVDPKAKAEQDAAEAENASNAKANKGAASINEAEITPDDERVDAIEFDEANLEFDEVEKETPLFYVATEAGKNAVEEMWSANAAFKVVQAETNYLGVWKKVLNLCAKEGGATKKEIADAVDGLPILQEPRRWCQYFLEKLKNVNALEFKDAWQITSIGKQLLNDSIFEGVEEPEIESESSSEGNKAAQAKSAQA